MQEEIEKYIDKGFVFYAISDGYFKLVNTSSLVCCFFESPAKGEEYPWNFDDFPKTITNKEDIKDIARLFFDERKISEIHTMAKTYGRWDIIFEGYKFYCTVDFDSENREIILPDGFLPQLEFSHKLIKEFACTSLYEIISLELIRINNIISFRRMEQRKSRRNGSPCKNAKRNSSRKKRR